MKHIAMDGGLAVPLVVTGCMRWNELSCNQVEARMHASLDLDIGHFDLADIYGDGHCEELVGEVLRTGTLDRESMIIQTKCGIRKSPYRYDLSPEYIHQSIEMSRRRLACDYIDIFTLHRPDVLTPWIEVADALMEECHLGHIRHIAVSNFSLSQMKALTKHLDRKICANQVQLSLVHAPVVESSLNANLYETDGVGSASGIIDYAEDEDIVLQAWSPLQLSNWQGSFLDNPKYELLNRLLVEFGNKHNCSAAAVAIAWILKLAGKTQVVAGTTSFLHMEEIARATEISLSREEWYALYNAAGHKLP